jgi:hypothetical protein
MGHAPRAKKKRALNPTSTARSAVWNIGAPKISVKARNPRTSNTLCLPARSVGSSGRCFRRSHPLRPLGNRFPIRKVPRPVSHKQRHGEQSFAPRSKAASAPDPLQELLRVLALLFRESPLAQGNHELVDRILRLTFLRVGLRKINPILRSGASSL